MRLEFFTVNAGEPVPLFQSQDLGNLVNGLVREALNAIEQIPPDDILSTPTEDIVVDLERFPLDADQRP